LEKSTDWFQAKSLPETMDFLVKYIEISFSFSLKTSVLGKFEFPDWPTENDHVPAQTRPFISELDINQKKMHIPAMSSSYRES